MAKTTAKTTKADEGLIPATADNEGTEVRAIATGFHDNTLRQVGDVFLFVPEFEGEEIPPWTVRADGKPVKREKDVVYERVATRADLVDTRPANAIRASKLKGEGIALGGAVAQSNHPEVQTAADKAGETNQIGRDGKPVVTQTKPLPPGAEAGSTSFA